MSKQDTEYNCVACNKVVYQRDDDWWYLDIIATRGHYSTTPGNCNVICNDCWKKVRAKMRKVFPWYNMHWTHAQWG
jgi:hypothetical protein